MTVALGEEPVTKPVLARPAARRRPVKPSGGILERTTAIKSRQVAVLNEQKIVPAEKMEELVYECRRWSRIPLRIGAESPAATIRIVADDGMAEMMVVCPEAFKAVVNVKALAVDGAASEVVANRLRKQIIRAALFVVGAGYSPSECLARPISSLKELDALNPRMLSAETEIHLNVMRLLGISEVAFCTYRQACREGWAPPPTNDVQKAIWENVHAIPKQPMKIEFDQKKGK